MRKSMVVIRLKATEFARLKALAESALENLDLNAAFPNPQPSLPALQAALAELKDAMAAWGEKGNRGSHADHVRLVNAGRSVHTILTQLAAWCMSALDPTLPPVEQAVLLSTTGFALKRNGSPQGVLEPVEGLYVFESRNILHGYIKLRWKRPLNVTTRGNVKAYLVYRNSVNDFTTATVAGTSSKTTFMEAPGIGRWFYWVAGVNYLGRGVACNPIIVDVFRNA